MDRSRPILVLGALLLAPSVACEAGARLAVTGPPVAGSVTARVVSGLGVDDLEVGIDLPRGVQVNVTDAAGLPVADAVVRMYPGGGEPVTLAHQGLGVYEVDVLSARLVPVEDEYYFEVESELLSPARNVMRVPHGALDERPAIVAPTDRSEHVRNENLVIRWEPVAGADCYDVATREHTLEGWEPRESCLADTFAAVLAAEAHGFNYIRIRARHTLGDETLVAERFDSRSSADAEVRIFFVEAEE